MRPSRLTTWTAGSRANQTWIDRTRFVWASTTRDGTRRRKPRRRLPGPIDRGGVGCWHDETDIRLHSGRDHSGIVNSVQPRTSRLKGMLKAVLPPIVVDAVMSARRRAEHERSVAHGHAANFSVRELGTGSPTLLLLNDCSDQANYGAEGLMQGLIRIFRVAIPQHTLRLLPSHWLIDPEPNWFEAFYDGVSLVQPQALWPEVADEFDHVADQWLAGRGGPGVDAYLNALRGVDIVVLNGEGSMYRTNLSAIRELFLAWLAKTRLGISTVFINGLVHLTLVVPVLPAMMRKTFRVLDAVTVRDPWSLRNVQEFMPDIPVRLVPDSALALTIETENPSPGVASLFEQLGPSEFFCFDPGPMPNDHRFGRQSALYQLIMEMKKLVPQAVMVASAPAETPMLRQLATETDSIYLELQPSFRDLMTVLSRARFQISGRNHNPVLGALVGCPAISLGTTSHKVHGICELLGFDPPYDGTDLRSTMEEMKAHAARHLAAGAVLRDKIKRHSARLAIESHQMGAIVSDILATRGEPRGVTTSRWGHSAAFTHR
jgi:polysaccharide pyruvyl transferase WcaK-like protein